MLSEIWTLLVALVLLRTGTMMKLVLGSIIVIRSKRADLPRIAEAIGTWFTRTMK